MKLFVLDTHMYPLSTLRYRIRSRRCALLFLFPVALYIIFLRFESAIVAFALPFFPDEPDKSIAFYNDLLHLVFREMLGYTGFLFVAWILWLHAPLTAITRPGSRFISSSGICATVIIVITFMASAGISYYTLDQFPNSSDEYDYVYQGETMSKGKLWEQGHDLPRFFHFNNIAQKDGIRVGRFPPGWPALLSIAFYFGIPAFLVNPILGFISLILMYHFAKKLYDVQIALWSLIAMAFTSFFIFTSASFFSHTSCMVFILAFVYCLYAYQDTHAVSHALLAGLFIGAVITIRYYTAVLIFIPFLVTMLLRFRWRAFVLFFWMGIGSLPCLALLLWYNQSITGNFLEPVTTWAYHDESLGFVRGHSPLKGIEHVVRWALMFLYWCSPALLILYCIDLVQKVRDRTTQLTHPEDYAFFVLVAGYFFYYQIGGNQYGPRFLFEALPFVVLFVTRNVFRQKGKWAMALFFAGCVYAVVKTPFIAHREHRIVVERNDLYQLVRSNGLHNAVVLIASPVSVIRPMPIGDLTRNDVEFKNDVLYAHDVPERNRELFEYYPHREFYRYVRNVNDVNGKLIKLDTN